VGADEGCCDGDFDGALAGSSDGKALGNAETVIMITGLGCIEGPVLGVSLGAVCALAIDEGAPLGEILGTSLGLGTETILLNDGDKLGVVLSVSLGLTL
jgi:hypothetical protein